MNWAKLDQAKLNEAKLNQAELNNASMREVGLNKADLTQAELNNADMRGAELTKANLTGAELNKTDCSRANLTQANLHGVKLRGAILEQAVLSRADLSGATLKETNMRGSNVDGTRLAYVDLTDAIYAPASPPPDPYVAGIQGLQTVTFPRGEEVGLVQLRDLLQKAGLNDVEREATYAIEHQRTQYALDDLQLVEGALRFILFYFTTHYGLHPARALMIIFFVWVLLTFIYLVPILFYPRRTARASGIYRVWPSDRIDVSGGNPTVDNPAKADRLQGSWRTAFGWAAYFSLLSAFHIGFRDFNVGTWLARLQAQEYVLRPIGWVRVVSGAQSLISVYLLAIWVLTYFGRPFQ